MSNAMKTNDEDRQLIFKEYKASYSTDNESFQMIISDIWYD